MTVVLESLLSAFFFGHKVSGRLLSGLGLAAAAVLGLYVALRWATLQCGEFCTLRSTVLGRAFYFVFELGTSAVIPLSLLLLKKVRSSVGGLAVCAGLTVFGMVLNRLDVCIVAFARPEGTGYFPTWMEVAVSLGIVSGGILIFLFFVERLKVYEHEEPAPAPRNPSYDPATLHGLLPSELAAPRRYSLVAIMAAAGAVVFLPCAAPSPFILPSFRLAPWKDAWSPASTEKARSWSSQTPAIRRPHQANAADCN